MRESTKKKVKYNAMLSVDSGAALGDCRGSWNKVSKQYYSGQCVTSTDSISQRLYCICTAGIRSEYVSPCVSAGSSGLDGSGKKDLSM